MAEKPKTVFIPIGRGGITRRVDIPRTKPYTGIAPSGAVVTVHPSGEIETIKEAPEKETGIIIKGIPLEEAYGKAYLEQQAKKYAGTPEGKKWEEALKKKVEQEKALEIKKVEEPKPAIVKEVPPKQTLAQIKEGRVFAYMDVPAHIKRKYAPIEWLEQARKEGKEVKFAEDPSKIPKSAVVFRPDQFSIKGGKLYVHDLPVWLEAKIKSEALLEEQKRRSIREQYREMPRWKKGVVALRRGLTDIPGSVELAYLRATGQTEKYEKKLTDVLVEEYGLEKGKAKGIAEAEVKAFTRGAGLIAISRPIGFGITAGLNVVSNYSKFVSGVISAGLSGYGLGTAIGYVGKPVSRKEYGEALGKGVLVGGAMLGAISGSYHAKKLGLGIKPKTVKLKPKEVLLRNIKKTKGKVIYRAGRLDIRTDKGNIKGIYAGKSVKNGKTIYRYRIPEQKVGDIIIKKQTVSVAEKDLIKWSTKIDQHTTYIKSLRTKAKLVEISPEKSLELSLQNVDKITKIQAQKGVTAFKRAGRVKGTEAFVEKGIATKEVTAGKGIMAKPKYYYKYYYVEKTIPKTKGFDYTPIIKSTKGAEKSVTTALKQMEALRQLQEAQVTASIGKGNVGRILPALLKPTEVKGKGKKVEKAPVPSGERISRVIANVEQETMKVVKPRKREEYVIPTVISPQALVHRTIIRQSQQLKTPLETIKQILRQPQLIEPIPAQAQVPVQRQIQRVPLVPRINVPELPRIPEPYPIEIGRPARIVPPFWSYYFYARLGRVSDINTALRQIKHKLIEAEKLL